ncbi:Rne/Rng family ribonuclease [Thalassococcus lentus]|uniref:Ribonuclease E n=1 Tax=Thalassococcus lentus TaxID=1210524 RepID=A0ABT4XX84_9RHOB|nr:ribonuclease E/G [Thalassococcus lentus]MDA7426580.1 ribonuclease E/G [Thalassococcus lentus]
MAKKMLIDATHAEETRVVVVDGNKVEEFDFESENKRQLAGNIYLAKVTRVEPSLQAAFVDYGGNRHGFLAFSEIHPDYYQIPVADRQALMEEEAALAAAAAEEDEKPKKRSRSRSRRKSTKAETTKADDAVVQADPVAEVSGMETIDLSDDDQTDEAVVADDEASSPMERVAETPVEEPADEAAEAQPAQADAAEADAASDSAPEAEAEAPADPAAEDTKAEDDAAEADTDGDDADSDDDDDEEDDKPDASERDSNIESVADDDTTDDIRPRRKPRPRKYKIQEVVKVRQILLVQVVKEERGNKGAALTTYLSLAGRYCVLMPNTARGGGISRKITNASDRSKLKAIAAEIDVPKGAGLIVRTAGAKRTKTEIKRDYEYLQRLWEQIRELTLKSTAPAKIYEEGDLIKRSIRDLYNREIDEVLVEGERGYRIAKDFMKMIMPSHAKNVKNYHDQMPLFARYQVESYLAGMFNPTVQLKSGGYIVIGVTEALVAIDVNSGRATKEGSIEETATKTNLEAAEEVARQLRLRDLAGLIVIDFIDMDDRKNNAAVEKKLKDKLKTDRARIQVGRISGFGLLEMSRQRLRPGMIEATTQPCAACHGTGLIRSDDNMALQVLRQIEEEGTRRRSREVLVKAPVAIANYLMNQKREHVAQIESRYGMAVRIEGDAHMVAPDFTLEKFKTATRPVPEAAPVVSVDTMLMDQVDEDAAAEADVEEAPAAPDAGSDEQKPKKRRRRRRRRSKSKDGEGDQDESQSKQDDESGDAEAKEDGSDDKVEQADKADAKSDVEAEKPEAEAEAEEKPKKTRSRSRSKSKKTEEKTEEKSEGDAAEDGKAEEAKAEDAKPDEATEKKPTKSRSRSKKAKTEDVAEVKAEPEAEAEAEEKPKPKRTRTRKKKTDDAPAEEATAAKEEAKPEPVAEEAAEAAPAPKPRRTRKKAADVIAEVTGGAAAEDKVEAAPEPKAETPAAPVEAAADEAPSDDDKPKRRGWWSLGR